jgi:laminin alpha 3/5
MTTGIICPCKEYVTGRKCDKCKDRYYGLDTNKEGGCSSCECNRDGTLNELELCDLNSGQCQCKLNVASVSCQECKSGFFALKRNDIFGCESCECRPGSSIDNECDKNSGQCKCLPNIEGKNCDKTVPGFYVPDLHQMKFEIEDGLTANGENFRYGFDESVFPGYSWKGYVHLNHNAEGEVLQNVTVNKAGTYRMIIRYLNTNLNTTDINIRVAEVNDVNDQQRATLVTNTSLNRKIIKLVIHHYLFLLKYLKPNVEPSFETVTVDQINALILELESSEYTFTFENRYENIFIVRKKKT